jgi:hypothetical protein
MATGEVRMDLGGVGMDPGAVVPAAVPAVETVLAAVPAVETVLVAVPAVETVPVAVPAAETVPVAVPAATFMITLLKTYLQDRQSM